MFYIRLHSPWKSEYEVNEYKFSSSISIEDADALLCEWAPHDELLEYTGPKIWYNSEAVARNMFNDEKWAELKANQQQQTFIYHAHPDPHFRVPMVGYVAPLKNYSNANRMNLCVAVTSNCGVDWMSNDILLRNEFATHRSVALYGREQKWRTFMRKNHDTDSLPDNYKGEIKWPWEGGDQMKVMSSYKAAICLENITEPFYFTEKFYAAVQANCIPIYHAHPTVKNEVLEGALWVDPIDFNFDVNETIEFALAQDRSKYVRANLNWLRTPEAKSSELSRVFLRLGEILRWHRKFASK